MKLLAVDPVSLLIILLLLAGLVSEAKKEGSCSIPEPTVQKVLISD